MEGSCLLGGDACGIVASLTTRGCHPRGGFSNSIPDGGPRESGLPTSQPEAWRLSTSELEAAGENHCNSRDHILERSDLETLGPLPPWKLECSIREISSNTTPDMPFRAVENTVALDSCLLHRVAFG